MDANAVDGTNSELCDRIQRRVTSHNDAIIKIDYALSELPRFEHHQHRDDYWTAVVPSLLNPSLTPQINTLSGLSFLRPMPSKEQQEQE